MSFIIDEISSQPECWRRAMDADVTGLPQDGERVAVIGCGTSLYIAQAYGALRESSGKGETDAFPASEFPANRRYDRVVAITRSGTTTEVLVALRRLSEVPTVTLTADAKTPVSDASRHIIELDFANERSVVQTRFATTSLSLLRRHLNLVPADLAEQAAYAVEEPLPEGAVGAEQITFLGTGWASGLAHEAALKVREASGAWTESYVSMEYRHGPISVTGPGRLAWFLNTPPSGLADEVRGTGGTAVLPSLDPLAELIKAQRLAVEMAVARGLDPDHPRNLTRSIVLGDLWSTESHQ